MTLGAALVATGAVAVPELASSAATEGEQGLFPLVAVREEPLRTADGVVASANRWRMVGVDPGLGRIVFASPGDNTVALVDTETLEQTAAFGVEFDSKENFVLDTANHRLIGVSHGFVSGTVLREPAGTGAVLSPGFGDLRVTGVSLVGEHDPIVRIIPNDTMMPDGTACKSLIGPFGAFPAVGSLCSDNIAASLQWRQVGTIDYDPEEDALWVASQAFDGALIGGPADNPVLRGVLAPPRLIEINVGNLLGAEANSAGRVLRTGKVCNPSTSGREDCDETVLNWSMEMPACPAVQIQRAKGVVMKSRPDPDAIHVTCTGAVAQHGVFHVDRNGQRGQTDPALFSTSFTHVQQEYEKVFAFPEQGLIILSTGTSFDVGKNFVFDASRRAFRAALEAAQQESDPSLHPLTGRLYRFFTGDDGDQMHQMDVTDTRPLKIGFGSRYPLAFKQEAGSATTLDPTGNRLFKTGVSVCLDGGDPQECELTRVFLVALDDQLPVPLHVPIHPDDGTEDVVEEPGVTSSSFSATAQAFGARVTWVGGVKGSAWNYLARSQGSATLGTVDDLVPQTGTTGNSGTRDTVLARVPVLNASGSSLGSDAQVNGVAAGVTIGDETARSLKSATTVAVPQGPTLAEGQPWPAGYPDGLGGHPSQCLDGGGSPETASKPGSSVRCDASVPAGGAAARFAPAAAADLGDVADPLVRVGDTETVTTVERDPELGMVGRAVAVARDVELLGGAIRIGEARTEAVAVAHGRPGTAATQLVRSFSEVAIGPPGEEPSFVCGFGDDCDPYQVVEAINQEFTPLVEAYIPPADTSFAGEGIPPRDDVSNGTPQGARAAVQRSPADALSSFISLSQVRPQDELPGLVVVQYADGNQPSRVVIQLAAVSLDAVYTVTSLPTLDFEPPPAPPGGPSPAPPPPPLPTDPPVPDVGSREVLRSLELTDPVVGDEQATVGDDGGQPPPPPPAAGPSGPPAVPDQGGVREPPPDPGFGEPPVLSTSSPQLPDPGVSGGGPSQPAAPQAAPPPAPTTQALPADELVARQAASSGAPLAALAALALLPGYLALRRGALSLSRRS